MSRPSIDQNFAIAGAEKGETVEPVAHVEDSLLDGFETALHDKTLSPETRKALRDAFGSVRYARDQARALSPVGEEPY